MSEPISPTVFHFLERNIGKKVMLTMERGDYGYEGKIEAVSHTPPGLWITDVEAIVLRGTVANPIPRVVSREKGSELFINLNAVQRLEILRR